MTKAKLTNIENELLRALTERFGDDITGNEKTNDQLSVYASSDIIFDLAQFLKDNDTINFEMINDICGVDWIDCPDMRFEMVYHFYSVNLNQRLFIRATIPDSDEPKIRSIQPIYEGADWLEREVYDMLGIVFEGHHDLRRILTPDDFEGWPHRKDFPLTYEQPHFNYNKDKPPEITR